MTDRLQKLLQMLEKSPGDAFTLYAVALEHKKAAEYPQALGYLDRTLVADPGYCYAYFQKGQVFEEMGRTDDAKAAYRAGIEAARNNGDAHAKSELEGALMLIE